MFTQAWKRQAPFIVVSSAKYSAVLAVVKSLLLPACTKHKRL